MSSNLSTFIRKAALTIFFAAGFANLAVHADSNTIVQVNGSSTVFPISEGIGEEFQAANQNKIKVLVGQAGTGGGFKVFCRGESDVQDASRPISKDEMAACKQAGIEYLELPIAFDALAIIVPKSNTWLHEISVDQLKTIWDPASQTKGIVKWNQVNPKWPDAKMGLYGASTDNGTFDYFTEAIVGKSKSSRSDYSASVNHAERVTGVTNDKFSLGYIPFSYYFNNMNKLNLVGVIGGEKSPKKNVAVLPNEKTVLDGSYYPLSRPLFIYVSKKSLTKPEVKKFAEYYLEHAAKIAKEVQYVPLPESAYKAAAEHLKNQRAGTVFGGGSQVGLTIDQILKKESKLQ